MDRLFRYFIYFLVSSVLVFAIGYIWLFLTQGDYAKGEFEIVNLEPYSIHIEMSAINDEGASRLFRGSIEKGKSKKFEKFVYGQGVYEIKLNKKIDFSIGTFNDKNNFSKRLIIKDDKAYFEAE
ncbi:MAG: hypothetical protein COC24_011455 [Alphaproteobacteria bacterium]|nr:hypothetical protein [Alphaproteobacteria bacterium]